MVIKFPHDWDYGGTRGAVPFMACTRLSCTKIWFPWEREVWKGNCQGQDGPRTRVAQSATGSGTAGHSSEVVRSDG